MSAIVASTEVERAPDQVFAYPTDPTRFAEWQTGVVGGHMETTGATAVGDLHHQTTRRVGGTQQFRSACAEVVHGADQRQLRRKDIAASGSSRQYRGESNRVRRISRNDSPWLNSETAGHAPRVLLQVGVEAVHGLGAQKEAPPGRTRRALKRIQRHRSDPKERVERRHVSTRPLQTAQTPSRPPRPSWTCRCRSQLQSLVEDPCDGRNGRRPPTTFGVLIGHHGAPGAGREALGWSGPWAGHGWGH